MNTTNADYFTFNVDSSLLIVGQTGTGKSNLIHRLIERFESAFTSNEMRYVLMDFKYVEFVQEGVDYRKEYHSIINDPETALETLGELSTLSRNRTVSRENLPLILIFIEECDAAAFNQTRFDTAFTTIAKNANKTNMKIVYATSRPTPETVSRRLLENIDLIPAGSLLDSDYEYLHVPQK